MLACARLSIQQPGANPKQTPMLAASATGRVERTFASLLGKVFTQRSLSDGNLFFKIRRKFQ